MKIKLGSLNEDNENEFMQDMFQYLKMGGAAIIGSAMIRGNTGFVFRSVAKILWKIRLTLFKWKVSSYL